MFNTLNLGMEEVSMKPMPINQANEEPMLMTQFREPLLMKPTPVKVVIPTKQLKPNAHEGNADKTMLKQLFSAKLRQDLKRPLV